MGDRANVQVKQGEQSVYLYTHWAGSELPATLQAALALKLRWDDDAYLTRIIFCEMVKDSMSDEGGYGIQAYLGDGSNRVLVVDPSNQIVSCGEKAWTFQQYIDLSQEEVNHIW